MNLQKREKLALLAMLAVAAAIGVTEIWFPQSEAQQATLANVPAVVPSEPPAVENPAATAADAGKVADVAAGEAAAQTPAEPAAPAVANVFPAQTWQPPPPPPGPPPKPVAPPLPFQYSGQLLEGEEIIAFLSLQKRQLVVKAGDDIDNLYRVEAITPQRIEFTYLPLKQKQELLTGRPL